MVTYIAHRADLKAQGETLAQFFSKMDKNGDQRLSKAELYSGFKESGIVLSDRELDELFEKLDTSKSGSISYTEYLAGAIDLNTITNEKYLQEAFNFFDKDGKGSLTKNEIQNAMCKGWLSETQLGELFKEIDTNKDSKITFLEFKKAMQQLAAHKKVAAS